MIETSFGNVRDLDATVQLKPGEPNARANVNMGTDVEGATESGQNGIQHWAISNGTRRLRVKRIREVTPHRCNARSLKGGIKFAQLGIRVDRRKHTC